MVTIRQKEKRETRQVRTLLKWHKLLKIKAAKKGRTISKLLDEVLRNYFEQGQSGNVNASGLMEVKSNEKNLNLSTKNTEETPRGIFE